MTKFKGLDALYFTETNPWFDGGEWWTLDCRGEVFGEPHTSFISAARALTEEVKDPGYWECPEGKW